MLTAAWGLQLWAAQPDTAEVPGLGTFVAPNLTLDKTTGLGGWASEQIVQAVPGPFAAGERAPAFVMKLVPPDGPPARIKH
jgi:hypothetical protein